MDIPISSMIFRLPDRVVSPYFWVEHIPFAFYIVEILKPSMIVELGVHIGNSFNAFCQASKELKLNTHCYGIDNWQGDQHTGVYELTIYEELKKYQDSNYSEFAHLVKSDFDKALPLFKDGSIDLMHIDGYHTYDAVKKDFENWRPKLSNRSVVLMHDTQVRNRDFGVWKLWAELADEYPSLEFVNSGGLGVLSTGNEAPGLFFSYTEKEREFFIKLFSRIGAFLKARIVLNQINSNLKIQDTISAEKISEYKLYHDRLIIENENIKNKLKDSEKKLKEYAERLKKYDKSLLVRISAYIDGLIR